MQGELWAPRALHALPGHEPTLGWQGLAQPHWELGWRAQPEGPASFGTNSANPGFKEF